LENDFNPLIDDYSDKNVDEHTIIQIGADGYTSNNIFDLNYEML
jgi:hypothetical protein